MILQMKTKIGKIKFQMFRNILLLLFCICILTACDSNDGDKNPEDMPKVTSINDDANSTSGNNIRIVTTIFPEYDWVRCILGPERTEQVELKMLLDKGVDMHSYQPTIDDIITISDCDMFIYVGGESDGWVKDALANKTNANMKVLNLMELLGDKVKEEEVVEGMEEESEECDIEGSDEQQEYDEHVWLSLRNADYFCEVIYKELSVLDPDNAALYKSNYEKYSVNLKMLNAEFYDAIQHSKYDTVLFGDRFPFRYLVDDYDIPYYAAFPGCSAETEASFDTILFLAKKVDELKLPAIIIIDGSDSRVAEAIRDNTASKDQQILVLDSMQSKTKEDVMATEEHVEGFVTYKYTYFSIMSGNLAVLEKALEIQ